MGPDSPIVLTLANRRWGPREQFRLEGDVLLRVIGHRQSQWPLSDLRRFTLGVRVSPYAKPLRFARLRFGRRDLTIVGGPDAIGYAAFVSALARAAAGVAPQAHFQAEGGRLAAMLMMSAALLGAGAVAMALAAVMAGLAPLGLDLAARLSFLVILVFAIAPWIGRAGPSRLDPNALPQALLGQV